ncbi:MAG: 50S ribosomal protein L21 [Alphaproteobacteria bacterium]|nr:MAG: 50S ribosomal protein L21 [Alphaproteobacteria bacterium]
MFAVIKTGGKQYRVTPGDVFTVERLPGVNGDAIEFSDILVISDGQKTHIGTPCVSGASVKARIINQERGEKIIVFKKKRRHNYRRKQGHRQNLTALQILEISATGISGKAEKLVAPKPVSPVSSEAPATRQSSPVVATAQMAPKKTVKKADKPLADQPAVKSGTKPKAKAATKAAAPKTTK